MSDTFKFTRGQVPLLISMPHPGTRLTSAVEQGLVPAGPPAYLVVEPDGSSTVRGEPEPAPDPSDDDADDDAAGVD